jgi:hypothetical protein
MFELTDKADNDKLELATLAVLGDVSYHWKGSSPEHTQHDVVDRARR